MRACAPEAASRSRPAAASAAPDVAADCPKVKALADLVKDGAAAKTIGELHDTLGTQHRFIAHEIEHRRPAGTEVDPVDRRAGSQRGLGGEIEVKFVAQQRPRRTDILDHVVLVEAVPVEAEG